MEKLLSLPILVFLPLVAVLILNLPFFSGKSILIRRFAKTCASLHFAYSLLFLLFFENNLEDGWAYLQNVQFFNKDWIDILGIKMIFSVDTLSLILVIFTSFIFLIAVIASKNVIKNKSKFYYSLIFILQTAVSGVFCARDMYLFFMFWELELIPMYFLISQWGYEKCKSSATKFVIYTFAGSLFMLLGIILLHFYNFATCENITADFAEIAISNPQFPLFMQVVISVLLFIGFAVKMPVFPFHSWLPDAHANAPSPICILLSAVLLKMGAYGIIRFNMQLLPEAFVKLVPFITVLALINIIYAAFIAFAQTNLKRIIAYSSVSNMGIILLGLCSLNFGGITGAMFHMFAHGVIAAALFMIAGIIYLRTKTLDLFELGGLGQVMPRLMGFALIAGLAAVGTPLLIGFVGEFLVFLGFFTHAFVDMGNIKWIISAVSAFVVLLLSSAYTMKLLHKTFFSNIFERWTVDGGISDVSNHEFLILICLTFAIIIFGIFPMQILDLLGMVTENLLGYLRL